MIKICSFIIALMMAFFVVLFATNNEYPLAAFCGFLCLLNVGMFVWGVWLDREIIHSVD